MIVSNRSVQVLFLGLFAFAAGCGGCEGCDPSTDAGPDGGDVTLTFVRPADGDTLGDADDSSAGLAGLQFDVVVEYSGPDGTELTLTSDQGEDATATVDGGEAMFENFDIAASENGIANLLTVTDDEIDASITVTGVQGDIEGTVCLFDSPDDGDLLTVDADTNTPGFQIAWEVRCIGEEATQMALEVTAGSGTEAVTTDGNGEASGTVTAANNNGNNSLVARLFNGADEQIAEARIAVTVNFDDEFDCVATITEPTDNQIFNADSVDVSADPGFQTNVIVDTGDVSCVGLNASAAVGDDVVIVTVGADGRATLEVTLDEGESLITTRVYDNNGNESFDNVTVFVDTQVPSVTVTSPVDLGTYGETDDLDGNKLNGISLPLTGTVSDTDDADYTVVCTGTGENYTASGSVDFDANGDFDIVIADISKPQCTLTLTLSDGENVVVETVSFIVDVPLLCSAVITSPGENTVYAAGATDLSADPGLQIEVLVDTLNPSDCSNFDANVTVGGTTFSAPVNAAGIAAVVVTAPEGMSTLVAAVTDGTVVSDVGDNEVTINVDTIVPTIAIAAPTPMQLFTSADDLDMDPNNGLEVSLTGTVTGQTSASYLLDCTGLGDQSGMVAAGATNFSLVLTGIDQGTCVLTMTATDGINTVMTTRTFSAALDLPCQAEITTPVDMAQIGVSAPDADPNAPGYQAVVVVETGNAQFCEGLLTDVDVDGTLFTGTVTNLGQAFVIVTIPDGSATITASVTDGVRVSDVGNNMITVVVDRTAPVLTLTSPVQGRIYGDVDDIDANPANGVTLALTGTVTGSTTSTYALNCTGDGAPYALNGNLNPDGGGNFVINLVDIQDPNCTLTVTVSDGVNSVVRTRSFQVADVAIVMSLLGDADDNGYWIASEDADTLTPTTIEIPVELTASFTVGTYTGEVRIFNVGNNTLVTTYDLGTLTSGLAATATISLPAGIGVAYEARGFVNDGAEDTGPITAAFIIDTVAPTLAPGFPVAGTVLFIDDDRSAAPGLQTFVNAQATGLAAGDLITINVVGPTTTTVSCAYSAVATGCNTPDFTILDGSYTGGTITTADAAGNITTIALPDFSVDATAPEVTSFVVVEDVVPVGTLTLAESGDAPGAAQSDITVGLNPSAGTADGTVLALAIDGMAAGTAMVTGNNATFTDVALAEGTRALTLSGTDTAGNPLAGLIALSIVVDTIAPTIAITAPADNPLLVANDKDPVTLPNLQVDIAVSTNAETGQNVELFDGAVSLGTVAVAGGAAVFADLTLIDGPHSFTAVVSDAAGNATTSAVYAPTVDATPPELTITAPITGAAFMAVDDADGVAAGFQLDVTVSHTGLEASQPVRIIDAGNNVLGTAPATGGSTTVRITVPNVDGEMTSLRARATEVIGNTATSPAISIQVQTGAYSVALTAPPQVAGMVQIGNAEDLGAGSVAIIVDVNTWASAPAPTTIELLINGVVDAGASIMEAGDTITITRNFADGETGTLEVRVLDNATKAGTSGVLNYEVDFGDPVVTLASYTDAQGTVNNPTSATFNAAADLSTGSGGLQVTLTADVSDCENGSLAVLEGATTISNTVNIDATGTQTGVVLNVTDSTENAADWDVVCTDLSANSGEDTMSTIVDITPPASPTLATTIVGNPRLGQVQVTFTAPGDDGSSGPSAAIDTVASQMVITSANFDAIATGPTYPGAGGLIDSTTTTTSGALYTATSTFLAYDNSWNFAIRAVDDVGNTAYATTGAPVALTSSTWVFEDDETDASAPGNTEDDLFGYGSSSAGDFNGDGYMDLAVAARNEGVDCFGAGLCEGSVRLIAGGPDISVLDTAVADKTLTDAVFDTEGFALRGSRSVAIADVNDDGFDDLLLLAVDVVTGPNQELHIYLGMADDLPMVGDRELVDTSVEPIIVSLGTIHEGIDVLGDINGDGVVDFGVGNVGPASMTPPPYRVFFGRTDIATVAPTEITIVNDLTPAADFPIIRTGTTLGDLDGDTYDEFAVDTKAGVFIIRGRMTWPAVVNVSTVLTADTFACTDVPCGRSKAGHDIDGDGNIDLVIADSPIVRVHLNDGTGVMSSAPSYTIEPANPVFTTYQSNMAVGDTNGDGAAEIIVLIEGADDRAELYFGGVYTEGAGLTGGVRVGADATYDISFSFAEQAYVSVCGDIDADMAGLNEVCIGSEEDAEFTVRY